MRGVDSLFLVTTGPDMATYEANAIHAAKAARVGHIVLLSVAGAESGATSFARVHGESEKLIRKLDIPFTFIRPVHFLSDEAGPIRVAGPAAHSRGALEEA